MCDTLVQVLPDRVLFAKNSDREADEPQQLDWQPARRHAPGARLRCTHIEIPQVERTHAVLLSRPIWMWGAEIGSNEHGVTIGNEAVFTRQRVPALGLTGMDLLRLGLERSTTAEEAVQVIVSLHQAHGQGGRCGYEDRGFRYFSSFLIADGRGAFVLETAGREAAVEAVRGARSISNGLTIAGFAAAHSDWLKTRVSACSQRRARTERGAAAATGVAGMMRTLRDHGDQAWPRYKWLNGAMHLPCMHGGGLAASSQTTGSWVAELSPGAARHFVTATAAPCLSLFKPVRVTEPLELLPPEATPNDSLWWRHERLHRRVMREPARLAGLFLAERDALEARFLDGEFDPRAAFGEGDAALARWTERVRAASSDVDVRPSWARRYWRKQRAV
jgi:secernin